MKKGKTISLRGTQKVFKSSNLDFFSKQEEGDGKTRRKVDRKTERQIDEDRDTKIQKDRETLTQNQR